MFVSARKNWEWYSTAFFRVDLMMVALQKHVSQSRHWRSETYQLSIWELRSRSFSNRIRCIVSPAGLSNSTWLLFTIFTLIEVQLESIGDTPTKCLTSVLSAHSCNVLGRLKKDRSNSQYPLKVLWPTYAVNGWRNTCCSLWFQHLGEHLTKHLGMY